MIQVADQLQPLRYRMPYCFAECALRWYARTDLIEPLFERRRDRYGFFLADLQYFVQAKHLARLFTPLAQGFDVPLDAVERADVVADDHPRECPPCGRLPDFLRRHVIAAAMRV